MLQQKQHLRKTREMIPINRNLRSYPIQSNSIQFSNKKTKYVRHFEILEITDLDMYACNIQYVPIK